MQINRSSNLSKLLLAGFITIAALVSSQAALRPPAVPLIACDPYFSIWSPGDDLTDADTVHWTGKPNRLSGLALIDGKPFRLMGTTPSTAPVMAQKSVEVLPTRTIYHLEGGGIALKLTFTTAALPEDISILSRPVTYLTCDMKSIDGASHRVSLYFDASGELAVNMGTEAVEARDDSSGLATVRVGSVEQAVLARKGDDIRIDWGYLYLSSPKRTATTAFGQRAAMQAAFLSQGAVAKAGQSRGTGKDVGVALVFRPVKVSAKPVSRWMMFAYDDLYSIQYLQRNLRPYWRRTGWEAEDLLKAAAKDYPKLQARCEAFDTELMDDLSEAGGAKYAQIAALAYRQCFAAGKFVADANGQPIQFCKENHSNGCIGTSDVFYPMSPQFLLFGPSVAKSFIVPFMNYAASDRWKFPFAPHDIGTYPHANGQVYGGGERTEENQMPVEETGNLLILMGAVAQMEGNAGFASLYWPQLEKWAEYLKAKGFDPENQLCTDDFAGHMAHNVNLSAKAIVGLGSFAKLCQMRGDQEQANAYFTLAREFAQRWMTEADNGTHYRLAFDRPGTWSQKYNLVWDRILGLNLFPEEVLQKEMAHYKNMQNTYGLPLDNRRDYTKLDWILWTATLTQNRADFEALVAPVYRFLNDTQDRSPMTDWYETREPKKVGFTARPVVGGVFVQLLYNKQVWNKYASRDVTRAADWAPAPERLRVRTILPAADISSAVWRYTTETPAGNWFEPGFDCSSWTQGTSGFGTSLTPGAVVGTPWSTSDIWLRREVQLSAADCRDLQLWMHHDEAVEVYVNGVLTFRRNGFTTSYDLLPLTETARQAFKPGRNIIAVHCNQTSGGQFIDLGLAALEPGQNH